MGKAAGVSRRRKKNARPNFKKRSTLKKQRKRQLRDVQPSDPDVKANWEKGKTTSDNMSSMGLVGDVNKMFPIQKTFKSMGLPDPESLQEEMELDEVQQLLQTEMKKKRRKEEPAKKHVVELLEQESLKPQPKNFKYGPELSKFIVYMIEKHGNDFKSMSRDARNRYQYSAGEIKKLIKTFVRIPSNLKAYERAKAECINEGQGDFRSMDKSMTDS